jgi:CubicO group peptidase (beta-lactamase class C family)
VGWQRAVARPRQRSGAEARAQRNLPVAEPVPAASPAGPSAGPDSGPDSDPDSGTPGRLAVDPDHLSDRLATLARKHQVPGAQLAVRHGGQTVAVEFGELEHGTGRAVTREAVFPIGSISKSFTATTAMVLVADGDLELDEPLHEHVPELADLGAPLTLRQLLSHTSGFASGPELEEGATASMRRYVLEHCRHENLLLAPGTAFSYSNLGYVLAGHVIETITGMSWWEAVESVLLRPLGIEPTFIVAPGAYSPRRPVATGHSVNTLVGRTRAVQQSLALAEAPAGALAVSAVDLVAFGQVHVGSGVPELLPAGYAGQIRQAVPGADPFGLADGWGLGLAVFHNGATEWVGHDGNADGTSCYLRVDPATGWVVAFTSNANNGLGLWEELLPELGQAGGPDLRPRTRVPEGRPAAPPLDAAGSYSNGDVEYAVVVEDGHLLLSVDGSDFARLTFHEDLVFSLPDPNTGQQVIGGRFRRDSVTGEIEAVLVGGRLARRRVQPADNAAPGSGLALIG